MFGYIFEFTIDFTLWFLCNWFFYDWVFYDEGFYY
jgi:hypothetical protein